MTKARPHAKLIKAWADGAVIQFYHPHAEWTDCPDNIPAWSENMRYRVKPGVKPDIVSNVIMDFSHSWKNAKIRVQWEGMQCPEGYKHNLTGNHIRFTFDGETDELKSLELVK